MNLKITRATHIDHCRQIEQLQRDIWGANDLEIVPDHVLITAAKEGGFVVLAYDDEAVIGFGFGFLGQTAEGRLKLASHMVGVLPAYQDKGVGYLIKLYQREVMLAHGIDLVTWTFDPLQSRNAYLNLSKLGATCQTYHANLYGAMRDELNAGFPGDRFRVDWPLNSERVTAHITTAGKGIERPTVAAIPCLNPGQPAAAGLLTPAATVAPFSGPAHLVEIPADIQTLKDQNFDTALQWRHQTRDIFQRAFAAGYTAHALLHEQGRSYYLLSKDI